MKKLSLLCLSALLSSGCACLPGSNSIVRLNLNSAQSASATAVTLTDSSEHSYLFFNGNTGTTTQRPTPRDTRNAAPTRVVLDSSDPATSIRKRDSTRRLPGVVFFAASSAKGNADKTQVAAAKPDPPRQPPATEPSQTLRVATREPVTLPQPPQPPQPLQTTATESVPSPQPPVMISSPPAGRVLLREQLEPMIDRHTRKGLMAAALSHELQIQPAAPAMLPRAHSIPLLSTASRSVRRPQPLLTVSQSTHRRQAANPELTESSFKQAVSDMPIVRAAVPVLNPVIAAVMVETPVRVARQADVTTERWNSARDPVSEHHTQPAGAIVQVSATQSQAFHPQSQPEQPQLRPIPMMLPPVANGAVANPCDCDPCKETIVHTDQIAALFQRVNDMEAALKRSHQSISTLEKNLNVANSDIVRLKQDVQYWQKEFGRLEASVQKQHESDIAALNRVSEMLGLLIEDATGSTDIQMVAPDGRRNAAPDASAAAITEGELR